ncbi:hypothetical protein OG21DRAFT_1518518 [Imleria badia]|nr:hypothetical protein OG21DRAFT_1518518 [Imleria badia]
MSTSPRQRQRTCPHRRRHLHHRVTWEIGEFTFSATTKDDDDAPPSPQKNAKTAYTRPQTVPLKRCLAHGKHTNGF